MIGIPRTASSSPQVPFSLLRLCSRQDAVMPISAQQWRVSVGLFNCSRMRWLLKGGGAKKKARAPSPSKTNARVVKGRVPLLLLYLMAVACVTPPLVLLIQSGDVELNPGPVEAAESVLKEYRDRFVAEMDASAVVSDLTYHGIIPDGVRESMARADDPRQRNSTLHDCLLKTCTNEALKTACGIITSVQGNPRMSALGKDMQRKLESVEGGGRGGGMGGGQVESFFGRLRNFYKNMTVVQDEWLPADQSLQYVNLALASFKLGHRRAHEMFVNALKEGVDNVYTDRSGKIQCEEIPKLAKEKKTVVVSGAPGVGKSTIARKVCKDICQAPDCHGYILVLLVELRDLLLFKKDFQLVDILQLFRGEMADATTPVELSKAISSNKGKDVLFILDGFDELPPHLRQSDFLVKLLSHNLDSPLRDCDVVLTSRSIVTSEIYHHMRVSHAQVSLANIEVLGFTQDQIKEYAGHYFKGQGRPDLMESFVSKIDAIPQVRGLCSIPVVLSIICQVFSFKQDLPPTLTEIYNDYMCIKVLKYHDLTSLDSILDLPRDHDIYKLGKIAFDCIQSQKVVFESSDLQGLGERFSDRVRGCGVLTARPVRADPKSKKAAVESFHFIHLTVQEFIAAVYVSLLPAEKQHEIWSKYLGEPHMAQVWRFYCGLTQLAHYELLQANITGYPKDFQMQCLFESQNASLVQKLMPHIVGEEVRVKPKTAYDSTAYGYCLSKYPALKKLTIVILGDPDDEGSAEIHRLLEPVYASGTLQTLCLGVPEDYVGTPEDWRQVEDLFDRIRNCDGALKGHFGKVQLEYPPLSVAVKLLCLQHVREVECWSIRGCEAMDHEVLKEMEKALGETKTLEKLTLKDDFERYLYDDVTIPKEFCRHLVCGIQLNTSLSEVNLDFTPVNWDCPIDVPADIHGSVQHVTLWRVPVDVLPRLFLWFSQVKHFECQFIYPPQEAMDHEVLKEMEKALGETKTLEKLTLDDFDCYDDDVTLPKEFCHHLMIGIGLNTSLSEVDLNFKPIIWVRFNDVPADLHGSVQHVTLGKVPMDVLPRLFLWFSRVKHLECRYILPPQECQLIGGVTEDAEVEQSLSGMGRLEKLVLGIGYGLSDSLVVEFGVSVLKGVSGNKHTTHFVLCDQDRRDHLLHSIIDRLPTDVQRHFIIDEYTDVPGPTLPCIRRSASGHPTLTWAPSQHFHPRPAYPHVSAVGYDAHSHGQHQAVLNYSNMMSPFPVNTYRSPGGPVAPTTLHQMHPRQRRPHPPAPLQPTVFPRPLPLPPYPLPLHRPETHLPTPCGAPGPSGITALPPPLAPPTPSMVAPTPPTQPFTAASDSPGPSQRDSAQLPPLQTPSFPRPQLHPQQQPALHNYSHMVQPFPMNTHQSAGGLGVHTPLCPMLPTQGTFPPLASLQTLSLPPCPRPHHRPGTHLPTSWGAPGPSGITASPPPPTAPPTSSMVAPAPPTQPFTAASDSPGPSQRDIPGPSWWTPPPPPGRRRDQQWTEEGTRPAQRSRVESTRFFSDHPLFYDVDFNALITKDPCLNSVQLPVEDEASTQEGTPSTHPH